LLSLWSFRPVREIIEKFAKIQVNPIKSDQIKPLFFPSSICHLPSPNFQLLNNWVQRHAGGPCGIAPLVEQRFNSHFMV
jgi:hypothetical protein